MRSLWPTALLPLLVAVLCLGSLVAPTMGAAATYYVAMDGGGNACSFVAPCGTVNAGLAKLGGAGDTLYIRGGTYNEVILGDAYPSGNSWSNPVPGGSVVWVGAYNNGGTYESVMIQGASLNGTLQMGRGTPFHGSNYVIWDHLHIHGTNSQASVIGAEHGTQRFQYGEVSHAHFNPSGPVCTIPYTSQNGILVVIHNEEGFNVPAGYTFSHNYLHDSPCAYAFYIQGEFDNLVIEDNVIANNAGYGIHLFEPYDDCAFGHPAKGVPCFRNGIFRNNLIYGHGYGIDPENGQPNHQCGLVLSQCRDCQVYNNVVYDNFCGFEIARYSENVLVANNTFYNNPSDNVLAAIQVEDNTSNTVIRNNLVYTTGDVLIGGRGVGTPAGSFTQSNNTFSTEEPAGTEFMNPPARNFHLQSSSAARGTGINLSSLFTPDKDGIQRPATGNWDQGPYQFEGSATPPPLPAPTNLHLLPLLP